MSLNLDAVYYAATDNWHKAVSFNFLLLISKHVRWYKSLRVVLGEKRSGPKGFLGGN